MIQEPIDKEEKENDGVNWKAWYVGLIGFLLLQIILYLWISISFEA